MMKNSVRLTLVALLFYLLQSLLCGIMIGTFCMNAVWAELSSAVVVVAVLVLMMRKKKCFLIMASVQDNGRIL